MSRGKIVGAVVLIVAVALVFVLQPLDRNGVEPAGEVVQTASSGTAAALAAIQPGTYSISPERSEVYLRIYAAGALASLGHNHVISASDMSGNVVVRDSAAAAEWSLVVPVAGLVVDNPDLRARYGEAFESVPSDNDKAGTKDNMLSERLLNGAAFPEIRFVGDGLELNQDSASLRVTIEIAGNSVEASFSAAVSSEADGFTISGEKRLTHAELGLTPFTALGGAMAVGDEIDFTYRLRAVAGSQ